MRSEAFDPVKDNVDNMFDDNVHWEVNPTEVELNSMSKTSHPAAIAVQSLGQESVTCQATDMITNPHESSL